MQFFFSRLVSSSVQERRTSNCLARSRNASFISLKCGPKSRKTGYVWSSPCMSSNNHTKLKPNQKKTTLTNTTCRLLFCHLEIRSRSSKLTSINTNSPTEVTIIPSLKTLSAIGTLISSSSGHNQTKLERLYLNNVREKANIEASTGLFCVAFKKCMNYLPCIQLFDAAVTLK